MNTKKLSENYTILQSTIDKVIGKIGLTQTIKLLENFLKNTAIATGETEKLTMVSNYIVSKAIEVFDIRERQHFYNSGITEHREARMSCYYLLRKYTQWTYPKIGLIFNKNARIVMYGVVKVEEWLSVPKANIRFMNHHQQLETKLIEFIGKI